MDIKKMLELYGIEKVGLCNENKRKCTCGTDLNKSDKKCPICSTPIIKSKLLNVNKNSALGKRYETVIDGDIYSFKYFQLLSNGFELYESEILDFSLNKFNSEVKISNTKVFKTIGSVKEFNNFMNDNFQGFMTFAHKGLQEFQYEYAKSKFTSLTENEIGNYLYVYINYRALAPYLRGYKIYHYGKKVNLKKYFPSTNFNDLKEIELIPLNLDLLLSWDIKNEKYIESIIEISSKDKSIQNTLSDILHNMLNDNRSNETYNNTINSFSLLYNKEISLEDFIRIYNNSRDNWFNQIFEFRKLHKKMISKIIDWSEIEKIDKKTIGRLQTKENLKTDFKLNKSQIEECFNLLEKDPLEALKYLRKNNNKND